MKKNYSGYKQTKTCTNHQK